MSEYFLAKYRPIADALLASHELLVRDSTRDMLADTIAHNRELPELPKLKGSRTSLPALRMARTHARKLLEYAIHPPARNTSVPLRCAKLTAAIRGSNMAVLTLGLEGIDTIALLDALDAGEPDTEALHGVVRVADAAESRPGGIGRPWAAATYIIRAGCITWARSGRAKDSHWIMDADKLTGALPDFLRDLIACCNGTHELMREPPRRTPQGYADPFPKPRGDALRRHLSDLNIRDGICAWETWLSKARRKNPDLSL